MNVLPSGRSLAIGFGLLAAAFLLYIGARETSVFAVRSIDVATEPKGTLGRWRLRSRRSRARAS
jgi:hypothetical protein